MPKKSKKQSMSRGLIILVLVLIGTNVATIYYFSFMHSGVALEDVPLQIADITDGDKQQYIGRTLTLVGYLVLAAGRSLLVSNPLSFMNNSLNSGNYLLVSGNVAENFETLVGQQVHVKGVVEWADQPTQLLGLDYVSHQEPQSSAAKFLGCNDSLLTPELLEDFTPVVDTNAEKYAILYSGGIDSNYAYYRYWNDLTWMYLLLLLNGYDTSHIYVIYKDGEGYDELMPVHYPATHDSMDTVFGILSTEMGGLDSLFFFSTNHGQYSGICTWEPLDPEPLNQTEVSDWFDSINCDHMVIVMEQCVSGKFIPYLTAANRVIMTACADDMSSYSCDTEGPWDEFAYHFMSALYQFTLNLDGTPVWADVNDDGHVSMAEAFGYAATMDSRIETPHYDDNGDGVGSTLGNIIGTDAIYGYSIFL